MSNTLQDDCRRIFDEYGEHIALNPRVETAPDASIVIPAWREAPHIIRTIDALVRSVRHATEVDMQEPVVAEVIIVDNDRDVADATGQIAEDCGVRVVQEFEHKGVSYTRQKGHNEALGSVILGSDADTYMPPTWVAAHMENYRNNEELVGVAGTVEFDRVHWIYDAYLKARVPWRAALSACRSIVGRQRPVAIMGANFSYQKKATDSFGGFHLGSDKGEDTILGENLAKVGPLQYDLRPEAKVITSGRRFATAAGASASVAYNITQVIRRLAGIPQKRGREFTDVR